MPASTAAAGWLSQLRTGTAGDPMFVTPYADPDVSALIHAGLDTDLTTSFTLGNEVASKSLSRSFGDGAAGKGPAPAAIAWPDGGAADAGVLTSLARDGQVGTTVLSSDLMPPVLPAGQSFTPDDAVTQVATGIGTTMKVALADSGLTTLLSSAASGASRSAQFSVAQEFLAETAMISAEAPNTDRSVVVAPPSRWDPPATEAATLLRETGAAPWLRPVPVARLAAGQPGSAHRHSLPSVKVAPRELSQDYVNTVKAVRNSLRLYSSLLYQPGPEVTQPLDRAMAATQSSAWRGSASLGGWTALNELRYYLADRELQVKIISGNKVVLAGTSGATPVSVFNGLPDAVQVQIHALLPPGSALSIGDFNSLVTVRAGETQTVRLPVHSAALGSTMMQLQLVTKDGMALPGPPQTFSVQATRFGRALLILIGAALGVLVLTSLARWVRRGLRDGAVKDGAGGADDRSGVSR